MMIDPYGLGWGNGNLVGEGRISKRFSNLTKIISSHDEISTFLPKTKALSTISLASLVHKWPVFVDL